VISLELVPAYGQRRGLTPRHLAPGYEALRLAVRSERPAAPAIWPCLLVLDAGAFTARCRWCGWATRGQTALDGAVAAFEGHACEESSP
jgi:hypothetical protein